MTLPDHLTTVFFEALHRASLMPFASEATLYALKSFGEVALALPVGLAVLGGLAGHSANMVLGRWLMRLPSSPKNHRIYPWLAHHAARLGLALLVLVPWSLGNILSLVAGMLGVPFKKAIPVMLLGLAYYYGRLLA